MFQYRASYKHCKFETCPLSLRDKTTPTVNICIQENKNAQNKNERDIIFFIYNCVISSLCSSYTRSIADLHVEIIVEVYRGGA